MLQHSPENAVLAAWTRIHSQHSCQPAIFAPDGAVLRTFQDIEEEAIAMQERFVGIPVGSVVALQIGNHPGWPAILLSLFRLGLIPLPLGRHMEKAELAAALETCHAHTIATSEYEVVHLHRLGSTDVPGWSVAPDFLKLTSGTTSRPRAIRFQAHQLLADAWNICRTKGIGCDDLNYGVIPFSHSYGFSNLVTPLLCIGVPLVATEDRLPRSIWEGLQRTGATVFPGMPVFYDKMASLPAPPAVPALRLCISAGAPLPRPLADRFYDRFGLKIHTFYGSSECGGISYDRTDEPVLEDGCVGTPMDGVDVAFESTSHPSRISVRSAAVGDGYYPEGDAASLSAGAFRPGDLARLSGGVMFLAGRTSDVINIAGRKLHPAEVEARLASFPGVRQVVVFGVPSSLRGEEPIACIAGEALDPSALRRFCRQELSEWQVPRDFWMLDEIPANERGKVSRRALADQFLATR